MTDLASSLPALLVFVFVLILIGSAAIAGLRAAPWVPTRGSDVERMLNLAGVKPGELVVDLGAGDGRFLIAAVKTFKARGIGYECSIGPWFAARVRLRLSGAYPRARVLFRDFYRVSLADADVIVCFLSPMAMRKLEPKFLAEAKPGARLVTYAFPFPALKPELVDKPEGRGGVYLYKKSEFKIQNEEGD